MEVIVAGVLLGLAGFFYTMGGFAGGSMFIAILLIAGLPASQAALGGLVFNIFSTGSSLVRWRIHASKEFLWFLLGSVPSAFLGGLIVLPDTVLRAVMGFAIAAGGVSVILASTPLNRVRVTVPVKIAVGAMIGVLAGLTGIGGGVYLAPILILGGIAQPKMTAATTTIFILLNSSAGIVARTPNLLLTLPNPLLLAAIPAVVIAAQFGSHLGSRRLPQTRVRHAIGVILMTIGGYLAASSFGT